MIIR
jgi:17beta-estradiol 17-dehydrogenase / very-long-chain 3-oxoacyl-CoA reductase